MVAAPYSPEMLMEAAELAGYAVVLSRKDGRARVCFTRLLKGRPRGGGLLGRLRFFRLATVAYRSRQEPMLLGNWWNEDCFWPGTRILAHLHWSEAQECYDAVWWNAVSIVKRPG